MATFEFTMKGGKYVALFSNGVVISVMTAAEVKKIYANRVYYAFLPIEKGPTQRPDGYITWPEVTMARARLGFVPRPLAYS